VDELERLPEDPTLAADWVYGNENLSIFLRLRPTAVGSMINPKGRTMPRFTKQAFQYPCALALLLISSACVRERPQVQTGTVRIAASFEHMDTAPIDHASVKLFDADGLLALEHRLPLTSGIYQETFTGIPVGTYRFEVDGYATADETGTPAFTGQALDQVVGLVPISVTIALHATGTPVVAVAPSIQSVSALPSTPSVGQLVTLSAAAAPGDVFYTWTATNGSFGDSQLTATGPTVDWTAPSSPGISSFTLRVTNPNGAATLGFALTVVPQQGPAVVNAFFPPLINAIRAEQDSTDPMKWSIAAFVTPSPDGTANTYAWAADSDCTTSTGFDAGAPTSTDQNPTFTFSQPGACVLTLTVTDPNTALDPSNYPYATGSITLTGTGATVVVAPRIMVAAQSATSAIRGLAVYFDVSAADVNSPPQEIQIDWTATSGAPTTGTGTEFAWTAPACSQPEGATIIATVRNDTLATAQVFTVLPTPETPLCLTPAWVQIATLPGLRFSGAAWLAMLGGQIYMGSSQNSSEVPFFVSLDPVSGFFTNRDIGSDPGAPNFCQCGYEAPLIDAGGQLFVFGNAGFQYDPSTDAWAHPSYPYPDGEWGVANLNDVLYYAGGRNTPTTVRTYLPSTQTWSTVADYPYPVYHPALAQYGNKIYGFGGETSGSNKIAIYDAELGTWSQTTAPFHFATGSGQDRAAQTVGSRIFVKSSSPRAFPFGTFDTFNGLHVFDPASGTWDPTLVSMPEDAGFNPGIISDGTDLYAVSDSVSQSQVTVWKYVAPE
jgi:hypothetical protein